ncbi:hypothetical protein [Arthrobacter oryzae]|uniref:hypothetical protein n=1 Tax=Arthrobacter oryzae TaxID=409290 RepID=UPI002789DCBE|nr:hypothetical protein [Arthrobacter oryzae]MDQ0078466.1 hypothetical protein [Arthrobacter oryzae]
MNNDQQPGTPQQPDQHGWQQPDAPAPGQEGQQQPFPPYPPQPGQPYPPQQGQQNQQGQPEFGQPPYPPRADQYNIGQPPYGEPGHGQYGQPGPGSFGPTPPKRGIPVWGWVAGGVGVAAVLALGGVMVLGGIVSANDRKITPAPTKTAGSTASAGATEEATTDESSAAASGEEDLYLFQTADFTSPPVWSVQIPDGWTISEVKDGTTKYRNSNNPCLFTTRQIVMPPSSAISDEDATKASMEGEIAGIKKAVGSPVTVVTDSDSLYAKLRNADGRVIELQEAEMRFKNKSDVDLVVRLALRAVPSANALMELDLACPANLPTESDVWMELADSVTMVDDPAV